MRILFIICVILLVGCSPQRKLSRLIKKHPELVRDTTIEDIDTFFINVPKVTTDTIFSINSITHDTMIIQKERLRIKTYYNHTTDSLYIFGECDEIIDTIIQTETIKVPYIVNKEETNYLKWIILLALVLGVFYFFNKNK